MCDMDGVLVNFVGPLLNLINSPLQHNDITAWDMCDQCGITDDEFWETIDKAGSDFWANLPKYEWTDLLMQELRKRYNVVLLSSAASSPATAFGKIQWVNRNFGKDQILILAREKHYCAKPGHILLDDRDYYCETFIKAGGQAVVFPQTWNVAREHTRDRIGCVLNQLAMLDA